MENYSDAVLARMTAVELATELNANARARMAAEPGLWVGELTTDHNHWFSMGVVTGLDLSNYLDAMCEREAQNSRSYEDHYGYDHNEIDDGRYDDDPSPYDGTYSEE